jgi:putative glycosyltransferase (TIGR04372 family)
MFFKKIISVIAPFIKFILTLFFIPIVLLIKLLHPIYPVRLGTFFADRIGHFASDSGHLLAEKHLTGTKSLDLFYIQGPICNKQLELMVKRSFHVYWWVKFLIGANKMLPNWQLNYLTMPQEEGSFDKYGWYWQTKDIPKAYLQFIRKEEIKGNNFLENLGLRSGDKFICLIVRDSAYLETHAANYMDWGYHDFRDSNIDTYNDAVKTLIDKGYWVFRMGKKVKKPLSFKHDRVIDYPYHPDRSDLLDIWLVANAYYTISNSTGLDAVAEAFRRPVLYLNAMTHADFRSAHNCLWAPKHLKWVKSKKYLTLKETLCNNYRYANEYSNKGIEVVDLLSSEIKTITLEMESRLDGSWKYLNHEDSDQSRYKSILFKWPDAHGYHSYDNKKAKISSCYLESNPRYLSENF